MLNLVNLCRLPRDRHGRPGGLLLKLSKDQGTCRRRAAAVRPGGCSVSGGVQTFFFPTIRRSAGSPRGCRHFHPHFVFASAAYLAGPGNAAISAQLRGKAVTRLSGMQTGEKPADFWFVNHVLHRGRLWSGLKVEVQAAA